MDKESISTGAAPDAAAETKASLGKILEQAAEAVRAEDVRGRLKVEIKDDKNAQRSLMIWLGREAIVTARVNESARTVTLRSYGLSIVPPGCASDQCPGRSKIHFKAANQAICLKPGEQPDAEEARKVVDGIKEAVRLVL